MNKELITYIKGIGNAEEKIRDLLNIDIMHTLSKHNPIWESENEGVHDVLEDARRALCLIRETLQDTLDLLSTGDEY